MVSVSIDRGKARPATSALKEWAAVVKALEQGVQILILRKGGIREEGFSADSDAFFLYPTGFHQTSDKLRPEYRHFLEEALAEKPLEGRVRIPSFAQVVETFSIRAQEKLADVASEYVYTEDEIKKRYAFRPDEALTAMAVRVYRLPAPVEIAVRTKYGGCVSWVNLEDRIPAENARPVLSDAEFQKRLAHIRSLFQ